MGALRRDKRHVSRHISCRQYVLGFTVFKGTFVVPFPPAGSDCSVFSLFSLPYDRCR